MKKNFVFKASVLTLSSAVVLSGLGGYSAYASENDNKQQETVSLNNSQEIDGIQDEKFDQYIQSLESFVQKNFDGTIGLNEDYKTLNIPANVISDIEAWMNYLNSEVTKGDVKINDDLSVVYTSATPNISKQNTYQVFATAAKSTGKNGFHSYWWGYKIYLNNKNTKRLVEAIYSGAAGAGLAAIVSGAIPTAPNQIVKALASVLALAGGVAGRQISNINKGKGVYLRFTGKLGPAGIASVFTGVYAQ